MGKPNMETLKRWLIWIVLPVALLSIVIDFSPWPGGIETLVFICLVVSLGLLHRPPQARRIEVRPRVSPPVRKPPASPSPSPVL